MVIARWPVVDTGSDDTRRRSATVFPAVVTCVVAGLTSVGVVDRRVKQTWTVTYRAAKRIVIAVIGATIVLLGVAMLVLPGPGLLTIVAGLAVLGLEFAFARRWLSRIKETTRKTVDEVKRRVGRKGADNGSPPAV
jgi:tellurite resistance protein TerC